jgi:toxin FitB
MKYLVDANVLSELTKPSPAVKVLNWFMEHEAEVAVDPIILGEIYAGILNLPKNRRRARLDRWFADVVRRIECLPWDAATGLSWGRLIDDLKKKGRSMPLLDSLIAATSLAHGLVLVTRNTHDFQATAVAILNPFD